MHAKHESEANATQKSQNDIASSRDVTIRKRSPSSNAIIKPRSVATLRLAASQEILSRNLGPSVQTWHVQATWLDASENFGNLKIREIFFEKYTYD